MIRPTTVSLPSFGRASYSFVALPSEMFMSTVLAYRNPVEFQSNEIVLKHLISIRV